MGQPLSDAALTAPTARRFPDRLFLACALAWGASLIHVEAATTHLQESVTFSVFFALLALTQALWGIVLYFSPSPKTLVFGAATSVLVSALWVVSRTSGLPFGPDGGAPEGIGILDSVATGDEIVIAVLVFFHLHAMTGGRSARAVRGLTAAAGIGLLMLSSLVLMLPGHHG